MGWFNRLRQGIHTETKDKKPTKEGIWYKCPECKKIIPMEDHLAKLSVCDCGYHDRIPAVKYFEILFDNNQYTDYCLSWGTLILGHAHEAVIETVKSKLVLGTSFGCPTLIETELASLIALNLSLAHILPP